MKHVTTFEQSRMLADVIPKESADMCYLNDNTAIKIDAISYNMAIEVWEEWYTDIIPCWSLGALLDVLPFPQLSKDKLGSGKEGWMVSAYPNDCRYDSCWHENPIDACAEMILKLHELKLI